MLKKLTAIFFIFLIAGQVSAGICGCVVDNSQPQHSCCKAQKASADALRRKGCCDNDCAMSRSERLTQDRAGVAFKFSSKAIAQPATPKFESFAPVAAQTIASASTAIDHRLKYSRPPELYLRHHAFLI